MGRGGAPRKGAAAAAGSRRNLPAERGCRVRSDGQCREELKERGIYQVTKSDSRLSTLKERGKERGWCREELKERGCTAPRSRLAVRVGARARGCLRALGPVRYGRISYVILRNGV